MAHGVSGTGSGFRVGWRAAGGEFTFYFSISSSIAFILAGGWALGYYSMGFRQFPDIY